MNPIIRGADSRLARAFGAGLAVLFALACAARTAAWARAKTETAGAGADLFRGDGRTAALHAALREIEDLAPKDATLAVLPEGALANFLTRRSNPTPYLALMPVEEIAYTPARVAAAYRAAPPTSSSSSTRRRPSSARPRLDATTRASSATFWPRPTSPSRVLAPSPSPPHNSG